MGPSYMCGDRVHWANFTSFERCAYNTDRLATLIVMETPRPVSTMPCTARALRSVIKFLWIPTIQILAAEIPTFTTVSLIGTSVVA